MHTIKEVAALFRITREQVSFLIECGDLPAINVGRGKHKPRYRITDEAIEAFKAKRAVTPIVVQPPAKPYKRIALGPRPGE